MQLLKIVRWDTDYFGTTLLSFASAGQTLRQGGIIKEWLADIVAWFLRRMFRRKSRLLFWLRAYEGKGRSNPLAPAPCNLNAYCHRRLTVENTFIVYILSTALTQYIIHSNHPPPRPHYHPPSLRRLQRQSHFPQHLANTAAALTVPLRPRPTPVPIPSRSHSCAASTPRPSPTAHAVPPAPFRPKTSPTRYQCAGSPTHRHARQGRA